MRRYSIKRFAIKKNYIWVISALLLAVSVPGVSWVSINKSHPADFKNIESNSNEAAVVSATSNTASNAQLFDQYINTIYTQADLLSSGLDFGVFRKAIVGHLNLKNSGKISSSNLVLTIVDFTKKSTEKRLWIVDLAANKLLYNTFVAHGQGSGGDSPNNFSDLENSHKSSLGFYIANETYFGKHGLSLKLDGLDKGFNTSARERAVVVHGASYVSQDFINKTGRLGRSHGCPALPVELTKPIINTIKGKTTLFINGPKTNYNSSLLNEEAIINSFATQTSTMQASL